MKSKPPPRRPPPQVKPREPEPEPEPEPEAEPEPEPEVEVLCSYIQWNTINATMKNVVVVMGYHYTMILQL